MGLLNWAGFLGCTAYFACPQGENRGLGIWFATLLTACLGRGTYLWQRAITRIFSGKLCINRDCGFPLFSRKWLTSFVPGTLLGACRLRL
ncbi:DUF1097 family protein [Shigella flexneri]